MIAPVPIPIVRPVDPEPDDGPSTVDIDPAELARYTAERLAELKKAYDKCPAIGSHCCDRCAAKWPPEFVGMILCSKCGNKRCPKAEWHRYACMNSNATGQVGILEDLTPEEADAAYDAAPSIPMSEERIAAIVAYATRRSICSRCHPSDPPDPNCHICGTPPPPTPEEAAEKAYQRVDLLSLTEEEIREHDEAHGNYPHDEPILHDPAKGDNCLCAGCSLRIMGEQVAGEFAVAKCERCNGGGEVQVYTGHGDYMLDQCWDCKGSGDARPATYQPRPLKSQSDREASEEAGAVIRRENAAAKRARIARREGLAE